MHVTMSDPVLSGFSLQTDDDNAYSFIDACCITHVQQQELCLSMCWCLTGI